MFRLSNEGLNSHFAMEDGWVTLVQLHTFSLTYLMALLKINGRIKNEIML